jgi:polar amino acid transport system permease protein
MNALTWFLIVNFDPEFAIKYGPKLFSGLALTIELVVISIVIGAALSLLVAMGRMSSNKISWGLTFAYVYVFRGPRSCI